MKAPKRIVYVVNTLMTLDALTIVRLILAKYGLAKFASWVFWLGMII
jgi:hypothetical protein